MISFYGAASINPETSSTTYSRIGGRTSGPSDVTSTGTSKSFGTSMKESQSMSVTTSDESVSGWESSTKKVTVRLPFFSVEKRGWQPRYFKRGVIVDGRIDFWSIRYDGIQTPGFVCLDKEEIKTFRDSLGKYYLQVNETIMDSTSDYYFACTRSPRGCGLEIANLKEKCSGDCTRPACGKCKKATTAAKRRLKEKKCNLRGCTGAFCTNPKTSMEPIRQSLIGQVMDKWTKKYSKTTITTDDFNSQVTTLLLDYLDVITEYLEDNKRSVSVMVSMALRSVQATIPPGYIDNGKVNVYYLFYFFQAWIRHIYKFGLDQDEVRLMDYDTMADLCDVMICTDVPPSVEEIIRRTLKCSTPNCAGNMNCRRGLHTKLDKHGVEVYCYASDRDMRALSDEIIPDVNIDVQEYQKTEVFTLHRVIKHKKPTIVSTGAGVAASAVYEFPKLEPTRKLRVVDTSVKTKTGAKTVPKPIAKAEPIVVMPECLREILASSNSLANKVVEMKKTHTSEFNKTFGMTHRGLNRYYLGVPEVRDFDRVLRKPKSSRTETEQKFLDDCLKHEEGVCGINMEKVKKRQELSRAEARLLLNVSLNCEFTDPKWNAVMVDKSGNCKINKWSNIVKLALQAKKPYLRYLRDLHSEAGSYSKKKKNFIEWVLGSTPTPRDRGMNKDLSEQLPELYSEFLKFSKSPTFKGYLLDYGLVTETFECVIPADRIRSISVDALKTWKDNKTIAPDLETFESDVPLWTWFMNRYNAIEWKDRFHENPKLAQDVMLWVDNCSICSDITSDEAWEMAKRGEELPRIQLLPMSSVTDDEYYQLVDMLMTPAMTEFNLVKDGIKYTLGGRERTLQEVCRFSCLSRPIPIDLLIENGMCGDFSKLGFITTPEQAVEYIKTTTGRRSVKMDSKQVTSLLLKHQEMAWAYEVVSGKVDKIKGAMQKITTLYQLDKTHGVKKDAKIAKKILEESMKAFTKKRVEEKKALKKAKKKAKEEAVRVLEEAARVLEEAKREFEAKA